MSEPTVGVIGIGIIGERMARNLLSAGYSLCVFNRTAAKTKSLCDAGATRCKSAAALARESDVIISVVSDSPDVEAIYLGADGVCEGLQSGALCIDMSTISPDVARSVAGQVAERGGSFLDAPVSGGSNGAEAGTLAIMVGGAEADVARAMPFFEVVGRSIVHCGPVGNGQQAKLCNQILCGLNLLAVSEAMLFAKRGGLDQRTMLEAVSKGAAGSWALDNLGSRMIDRDFDPMFMIDLQQKDLAIVLRGAAKSTLPLPGTALVHQLLAANQAAGEGREGTQALVKTLERLAQID